MYSNNRAGDLIGFRKSGIPIYLIGGGAETDEEGNLVVTEPKRQEVPAPNPPVDPDKIFTREDIEKARREEKDKLYARLTSHEERIAAFEKERAEREAQVEAERAAAEKAERERLDSESDVRTLLEQRTAEFEARIAQINEERDRDRAILEQERALAALNEYKQRAIHANEDKILPELLDYVVGDNSEEIDASIAGLVQRSEAILSNTTAALSKQRSNSPGARVTAPPSGPLEDQTSQKKFSPEEISRMTATEFAKYRSQFGVTGGATHRGMFS